MNRDLTCRITARDAGMKIQDYLRALGCSHHVLTHLKRTENGIVCNGTWEYASHRLEEGDVLTLHIIEEASSEQILPVPMALSIVYEDDDLMVIDKPADLPIHPSIGNYDNTLANGVMHYFTSQKLPFVYRCVNRLDRDTSGLLIIAKNMLSGAILYQMSADRQIRRQYLAIVEGITPECGTIDAPIARKEGSALMRCIDYAHGDRAVTHYERLSCALPPEAGPHCPVCSLLRIRLETGRTHQIRVHMTETGHPLAGDFLYNPGSDAPIHRQALHSHSLDFLHPITKEPLHFVSALPADMARLLPAKS